MKKLFKLGLVAAVIAAVYKMVSAQKEEWSGLSEAEVRDKLSGKLGDKVPEDKLEVIGDKVVGAMRDKGRLREDAGATDGEAQAPEEG